MFIPLWILIPVGIILLIALYFTVILFLINYALTKAGWFEFK